MIDVRSKFILAILATVLAFSSTAMAQDQGDREGGEELRRVIIYTLALEASDRGDHEKAFRVWRSFAEEGDDLAQYSTGIMFMKGRGTLRDAREGYRWFRLAAEQGFDEAQYNLGVSYFNGDGVSQDYVLAHKWLNLAAALGSETAPDAREIVASHMTPTQIAEAQKLAREWLEARSR